MEEEKDGRQEEGGRVKQHKTVPPHIPSQEPLLGPRHEPLRASKGEKGEEGSNQLRKDDVSTRNVRKEEDEKGEGESNGEAD